MASQYLVVVDDGGGGEEGLVICSTKTKLSNKNHKISKWASALFFDFFL